MLGPDRFMKYASREASIDVALEVTLASSPAMKT